VLTNNDLQKISAIVKKETVLIVKKETTIIVRKETVPIIKSIRKLERKMDFSVKYLDREFSKRIKRLEDHSGLEPMDTL